MKNHKICMQKAGRLLLTGILTGMILSIPAYAARIDYAYDETGRLTNAAYSGGAGIAYAYDANGNMLIRETSAGGAATYTLIYLAGAGGSIAGIATQEVAAGDSGSAVTASPADTSVVFHAWSDGLFDNPRTDTNVSANLTVSTVFRSEGGADLDWYAGHGFVPEGGELWSDLDTKIASGKGTTLLHEFIADTDPNNTGDIFRVLSISNGPPVVVRFQPGSTGRVYTFQYAGELAGDAWTNVPGTVPRPGLGGQDAMTDTNPPPFRSYRIEVQAP
ncbi:MAG: RHS repeat protein [Kiritimatiellae bacterium]|nr:RHS repeat protein [Kiritimatiellia bacterium]